LNRTSVRFVVGQHDGTLLGELGKAITSKKNVSSSSLVMEWKVMSYPMGLA
jgi:hypothetical protein